MIATGLERDENLPDLLWNSKQKCKYENPGIGLERKYRHVGYERKRQANSVRTAAAHFPNP